MFHFVEFRTPLLFKPPNVAVKPSKRTPTSIKDTKQWAVAGVTVFKVHVTHQP